MKKNLLTTLITLLFILSSACSALGGTSQTKLDPRTASPCEFLTKEEASEILGKEVKASQVGPLPQSGSLSFANCVFASTEGNEISSIGIFFYGRTDPAKGLESFQVAKERATARNVLVIVENMGDEAIWGGDQLMIRKGNLVIGVIASTSLTQVDLEKSKLAASKVLARIQE